jgi:flagellar biosynthetic protein FliR
MQELISLFDDNTLFTFLLLFARMVAFVAFMPVFGHKTVPAKIRVIIAFYFTVFVFPMVDMVDMTEQQFLLGLISEITLGLVTSFLIQIMFNAVTIIGDLIAYSTALSMANMFDPASGTQQSVVSRLLYMVALMIYFQTNMYELTIMLLLDSFGTIQLGHFNLYDYDGLSLAIKEITGMFAFAFAFALPLFFIGFILDIYYSYGTRSMPAFSPFVITFQLKFAIIFLFLIFGMDIFVESFKEYFFSKTL